MTQRVGVVGELWRYPVMGLRGEQVGEVEVVVQGVLGDRAYALYHRQEKKIVDPVKYGYAWGETAAAPGLLEFQASFDSAPTIGGLPGVRITTPRGKVITSNGPGFEASLEETLHLPLSLLNYPPIAEARPKSGRAIHMLTTSSLRAIKRLYPQGDFDVRRFRPNVLIETPEDGYPEEGWMGRKVSIGGVKIKVEKPNQRCKVTTMKQGEIQGDPAIHETISTKHDNVLGVMCSVLEGGRIRLGDQVELLS